MRKILCSIPISLFVITSTSWGQSTLDKLTVEKIMRDAKWLGSSPFSPRWSADAKTLYFNWNPEKLSLIPVKATVAEKQTMITGRNRTLGKILTQNSNFSNSLYLYFNKKRLWQN